MSRFSEKGYYVKENAAVYFTKNMDDTVKWFDFHGVSVVPLLLINTVCAGGYQFDKYSSIR